MILTDCKTTKFHAFDDACSGVFGSSCQLGFNGLDGCVTCNPDFNSLKQKCMSSYLESSNVDRRGRTRLVRFNNAAIIGSRDHEEFHLIGFLVK